MTASDNNAQPTCWIITGPNGAGKTTFALEYLPAAVGCNRFVNADLIAAGLAPLAPERQLLAASRLFLEEIKRCAAKRESFAFETTLAGRSWLRFIDNLKAKGWKVELIYLALPSVSLSAMRVAERVAHGGHNIPTKAIQRRFPRSLHNLLNEFSPRVDHCACYMNSGLKPEPVFYQQGQSCRIAHQHYYELLLTEARK